MPSSNGRRNGSSHSRPTPTRPVRFAVVGAGHFAQTAILPAFDHTRPDAQLAAIVTGDAQKARRLSRMYGVEAIDYDEFDDACDEGLFDAVYIATPNTEHAQWCARAARHGVHVLTEKPMATSTRECRAMIRACAENDARLMVAYRLHFEAANLRAVELIREGRIGEPRLFSAAFSFQVRGDNIRADSDLGGGPLFDIGLYCINAARYLFGEEPTEVSALGTRRRDDPRFSEIEEAAGVVMRFPGEKLATFSVSFGAADTGWCQVVGTEGDVCLDPAFEYKEPITLFHTEDGRTREHEYPRRDQIAPEIVYFARCIRDGTDPEPGGEEGYIDVAIIESIFESMRTGRTVPVRLPVRDAPPDPAQRMRRPPARPRPLIHAEAGNEE